MKLSNVICFLYLLFLATPAVYAGGMGSSGGDNFRPEHKSAWFLQDTSREIKYCIENSSDFSSDTHILNLYVDHAFTHWKKYFDNKHLSYNKRGEVFFKTNFLSNCNGNEDLTFYFGISNQKIEKEKKQHDAPVAFAVREKYNHQQGWGKGYVWVTNPNTVREDFPNWNVPSALFKILTHEIGHILGCGHVDNTIMRSDIARFIHITDYIRIWYDNIDHEKELVAPTQGETTLKPYTIKKLGHKLVVGKPLNNSKVLSTLTLQEGTFQNRRGVLELQTNDDKSIFHITFNNALASDSALYGLHVFKTSSELKPSTYSTMRHKKEVWIGSITSKTNSKSYPVLLEYNMGEFKYILSLLTPKGEKVELY